MNNVRYGELPFTVTERSEEADAERVGFFELARIYLSFLDFVG